MRQRHLAGSNICRGLRRRAVDGALSSIGCLATTSSPITARAIYLLIDTAADFLLEPSQANVLVLVV